MKVRMTVLAPDGTPVHQEEASSVMSDLNVHNIFNTPRDGIKVTKVGIQLEDGSGVMWEPVDGLHVVRRG